MIVREITRRGGTTNVRIVNYTTGETLAATPDPERNAQAHQLSQANGITGTEANLRAAQKLDAELGVPIRYVATHRTVNRDGVPVAAYRAEFENRPEKNRWLRAHKRVDYDASYGDPCPGDFKGSVPREFER